MIGANALARTLPFVAILGAAAYFYYLADHLDFPAMSGRAGPDLWPKIILGLMIGACAIGIAKVLRSRPSAEGANLFKLLTPSPEAESSDAPPNLPHLALLGIGLFVAYVLLLDVVGFVICTAVLIVLFLRIGRYRNLKVIAIAGLIGSLGFFYIFRHVVYVSLPLGKEPFMALSVWLMKIMGMS
jgi:putative tricarboxylic transport membrane protein